MANRNPNHPWRKQSRFFSTKPAKAKTQKDQEKIFKRGEQRQKP